MRRAAALAVLLAILGTVAPAGPRAAILVRYRPKGGEVDRYDVSGKFELGGNSTSVAGSQKVTVEKVTETGYVQRTESKLDEETTVWALTIRFGGEVEKVERKDSEDDEDEAETPNLQEFVEPAGPIEVGHTWTRKVAAVAATKVPAYEITYEYAGDETVGDDACAKFVMVSRVEDGDTPKRLDGIVWLSKEDWSRVKDIVKTTVSLTEMGDASFELTTTRTR